MKTIILFFSMLISLSGCNDDNTDKQENSIYGTWQLVESYAHPPTGQGWINIEGGYKIIIKTNGKFTSTQFSSCDTGVINIIGDKISFVYDCNEFTAGFEKPEGSFVYNYKLTGEKIELEPQNFSCFEGCKYRLIKLKED